MSPELFNNPDLLVQQKDLPSVYETDARWFDLLLEDWMAQQENQTLNIMLNTEKVMCWNCGSIYDFNKHKGVCPICDTEFLDVEERRRVSVEIDYRTERMTVIYEHQEGNTNRNSVPA